MRFMKITAVAAALLLVVAPVTSCNKDKKGSSSSFVLRHAEGENVAKQVATADVAQEVNANQTLFTLNKIYDAGVQYFGSPFTVSANSTFNGVVGGFCLKDFPDEFTVGFFPTREDRDNKEELIKVKVTKNDIVPLPDELKKK